MNAAGRNALHRRAAPASASAEDLHTIYIVSIPHLHAAAMELDIGSPGWPAGR